jgi:NADH-quinone oxidoreductase subunit N
MFSLTGIPPFAGFVGKYYLFASAVQSDLTWLAIVGVITSLFSTYYYLRIVVYMYFRDGEEEVPSFSKVSLAAIALAGAGIVVFGVVPSLILDILTTMF